MFQPETRCPAGKYGCIERRRELGNSIRIERTAEQHRQSRRGPYPHSRGTFQVHSAGRKTKARLQLPSADAAREERQVERLRTLAQAASLDPEFAEKFLSFIIKEVILHHDLTRGANADV